MGKICVGVILGAHGVRGQVRLRSLTQNPEDVFAYGTLSSESGERSFGLKRVSAMKDYYVVSIQGLTDRDEAEALRGQTLFVDRDDLPEPNEREYYEADLVGLAVQDGDGINRGQVLAVHNYGAGSFLEIQPKKGASFMVPFKDAFVPAVDVAAGLVRIELPENWLKDEKEEKSDHD
jgi:16S rRNA processing protein RimM